MEFQKKKWAYQAKQRADRRKRRRLDDSDGMMSGVGGVVRTNTKASGIGGFLRKTARTMMDMPWQIVQIAETGHPGFYRLWALIGSDLHSVKLTVPRIFYVNQRTPKDGQGAGELQTCLKQPLGMVMLNRVSKPCRNIMI